MDAVKKKKKLFSTHKNQEGVSVSLSQRPSHGSSMNSTREISLLELGARQDPVMELDGLETPGDNSV